MSFKYCRNCNLKAWLLMMLCSYIPVSAAQFDDGARYAFSASQAESSIMIFDLYKQRLAQKIKLDSSPDVISVSENLKALVVGHQGKNSLTLIDLSSKSLDRYDYPLTLNPDYVSVSPLGETVAVYDRAKKRLEVHAVRRRDVLLRAENVDTIKAFTFNLDGSKIYWTSLEDGSVHSIDLWSQKERIKLVKNSHRLSAVTRTTDGRLGFISNESANQVVVIDLPRMNVIKQIRTGLHPGRPWGTADGRIMLIPNHGDGSVTAIATSTLEVLYTVPVVEQPVSINPGWLDSTAAVIGAKGVLRFIDVNSGSIQESIELNSTVRPGIVTSDSKLLALPLPEAGELAFFDMRKRSLSGRISGLPQDLGGAVLAISNNLCH